MTAQPQSRRVGGARPTDRERTRAADSRATDTRARDERPPMDAWAPSTALAVPQSHGDYVFRWIAEYVNGVHTPNTVNGALREGYTRVRIDELPEDFIVDEDLGDGYARTGGLILMRLPKHFAKQRRDYYRKRSRSALQAANELQGVAGKDAVSEDRGTVTLSGSDAANAIRSMSQGG